jgi:hypothetical protein
MSNQREEYFQPNISNIDIAFEELRKIKDMNLDPFDKKIAGENIHQALSDFLFQYVASNDIENIIKILGEPIVLKSNLLNADGYNLVEYLLINSHNFFFMELYTNYKKYIDIYFLNIPALFTVILNKKNYELINFFLKTSSLGDALLKENLSNLLFVAVQGNQKDLVEYIIHNYDFILDARNVEATVIYFLSNGDNEKLEELFLYDELMKKFTVANVEKLMMCSVLYKNMDAIYIMAKNQHIKEMIGRSNPDMQKSISSILQRKMLEK